MFSLSPALSLSLSSSLSLSNSLSSKIAKILLPSLNQVPRTKPNKPCDGNKIGTPSPYNISISGVHPLHTFALGIWLTRPYNFGTSGVHPLCTSVLRSSCLETYHISLFSDPPPCPPFLCSRVLLLFGVSDLLPVLSICVWVSNQVDTVVLVTP